MLTAICDNDDHREESEEVACPRCGEALDRFETWTPFSGARWTCGFCGGVWTLVEVSSELESAT